jgi:tetratricopeptide (TPR) repeat protein
MMLAQADETADQLTREGIASFTTAWQAWDGEGFATAAAEFRKAAARTPDSPVNCYWQGVAQFHRMLYFQNLARPDKQGADAAMEAALAAFESAVRIDPRHAESHALLGTLYGMKIHGGLLRAIRYGPRVQNHQQLALAHGPRNPRVRWLLGTGLLHTAKNQADRRKALETLLAAEKLFEQEASRPPAPFEPRWGHGSCRTFIGRAYLELDDKEQAARWFRLALAVHPNDHIAKRELAKLANAH